MAILAQLQRLFLPNTLRLEAQEFYVALVTQARQPEFYTQLEVPDTLDGRFDMITLHMYLLLDRLKASHNPQKQLMRMISEAYFADMSRSLREMGVGDIGVMHRIKKMASAFYGRMDAYTKAKTDNNALHMALRRNVYGTKGNVNQESLEKLAIYVRSSEKRLAEIADDQLTTSNLAFTKL